MNKLIEFFNEKYGDKYGKIPYPRTTMQIYRVYQSIKSYGIKDEELVKLLHNIKLPKPKSIEEKELYTDCLYNKDDSEMVIDTSNLISKENPVFTGSVSLGRKSGTEIGDNSYAVGTLVEASGNYSHAEGSSTQATGEGSHAEGQNTQASGLHSHAEGENSIASGLVSHAEGWNTEAKGKCSHAEGNGTTASGEYQHVQGKYNIKDATNKYAHIVGNGNYDTCSNAHTLDWHGNAWYAGQVEGTNLPYVISEKVVLTVPAASITAKKTEIDNANKKNPVQITVNGTITCDPAKSYCVKYNGIQYSGVYITDRVTIAENNCFCAIMTKNGKTTLTIAALDTTNITDMQLIEKDVKKLDDIYLSKDLKVNNSITVGARTGKIGDFSSSFGLGCEASGDCSHAEGSGTTALGVVSHAEGANTTASGNFSHAEGYNATASGISSHAEGSNTIASCENQHVQGKNNIEDNLGKYAHIVGNGEDFNNRSNAHTLDWEGNAWYAGKLSQEGTPTEDKDLITKKYADDSRDNLVSNIYGNNIYNFQITEDEFNSLCNLLYNDRNNKIALNSISSDTLNTIIGSHTWYNAISFNKKIILKVKSTGSGGLVVYTKGESADGHVNYTLLSLKSNESNIVTISHTSFIEYNYNDKITNLGILNNNKVNIQKGTKNQYINATKDFELVLPNVTEYIEIHLYLTPSSTVSITFPPSIKWKDVPTIEANKVYEIIFKYINETIGWIGEYKIYN